MKDITKSFGRFFNFAKIFDHCSSSQTLILYVLVSILRNIAREILDINFENFDKQMSKL